MKIKVTAMVLSFFCFGILFSQTGTPISNQEAAVSAVPAVPVKTYTDKEAREEVNKALKTKLIDVSALSGYYERINKGKTQEVMKELLNIKETGGAVEAGGWPNFLGPNRDGTSTETGLLRQWPEKGPKVAWRIPITIGWSCPSVSGDDLIFIQANNPGDNNWSYTDKGKEDIICLSAKDGKKRWQYEYNAAPYYCAWWQGGPRATPTITDKFVYTLGMMGHLTCLDRKNGNLVWQTNLNTEELGTLKKMGDVKGYIASPVIINGVIVLHLFQEDGRYPNGLGARAIGIDAKTGKQLWLHIEPVREKTAGALVTAVNVIEINKEKNALMYLNRRLTALRPSDGKVIWAIDNAGVGFAGSNNGPLGLNGKKVLFVQANGWDPLRLMEIDWASPKPEAKSIWTNPAYSGNSLPFIYYKDNVFGFEGVELDPNNWKYTMKLICVDGKNGNTLWKSPVVQGASSLIAADGLLFVRYFKTLKLVEAGTGGYVEKGKVENLHNAASKAFDGPALIDNVMPVLANGKLYIRCPAELICFDVKDEKVK